MVGPHALIHIKLVKLLKIFEIDKNLQLVPGSCFGKEKISYYLASHFISFEFFPGIQQMKVQTFADCSPEVKSLCVSSNFKKNGLRKKFCGYV